MIIDAIIDQEDRMENELAMPKKEIDRMMNFRRSQRNKHTFPN